MAGLKKIYIVLISIILISTGIFGAWIINNLRLNGKPENSFNADEFFSQVYKDKPLDENSSWTIYDKVEKVYLYKLPEIDFMNRTYNLDILKEYTAIKFVTSYVYLKMPGNHIDNFTVGTYTIYQETTRYVEWYEFRPQYSVNGTEINRTEGEYLPIYKYNYLLIGWFKWLSYGIDSINYTIAIMSSTELKLIITDVADYYPHPVQWNQVEYSAMWKVNEQGLWSGEGAIDNVRAFQENNIIYDYSSNYSSEEFIKEGQYIIIYANLSREIKFRLFSLKYHEIFELPNVDGLGDELFELNFIP